MILHDENRFAEFLYLLGTIFFFFLAGCLYPLSRHLCSESSQLHLLGTTPNNTVNIYLYLDNKQGNSVDFKLALRIHVLYNNF